MMTGTRLKSTDLLVLHLQVLTLSGITHGQENGSGVVKVGVIEGGDVILPCSLSDRNIVPELFEWRKTGQKDGKQKQVFHFDAGLHHNNILRGQDDQFKGRVSHFPEQLKHGNASIILRNATMADRGIYTCAFPRLQPKNEIFHIQLDVELFLKDRSGEISGVSRKPCITTLDETKDWSLLQCEVRGASPKPKVEWQDSAGNILPAEEPQVTERGGSYDITLNITVTKTERYRCVATQEEIGHRIYTETYVYFNENKVNTTGWFLGVFFTLAGILLVIAVAGCIIMCRKKGSSQQRRREIKRSELLFNRHLVLYGRDPIFQGPPTFECSACPSPSVK